MKGARLATLCLVFNKLCGTYVMPVCIDIIKRSRAPLLTNGTSKYARRRRAKSVCRCERCYRVFPSLCNGKCDNKTCKPGISYREDIKEFILWGVTEVIPQPGNCFSSRKTLNNI
uniref:RNA silencing suppressor n=1 Tax=Carlavirus americanense TaxID=1177630 RepID=A0A1I7P2Z7_9VIRU|nr:putative nucleic acid binding protein [American hop latent virus]